MSSPCRTLAITQDEAYALSKRLIAVWAQKAAHDPEFRSRSVRVNVVIPGAVATPLLSEFRGAFGSGLVDRDISISGRAGRPRDIAIVIAF